MSKLHECLAYWETCRENPDTGRMYYRQHGPVRCKVAELLDTDTIHLVTVEGDVHYVNSTEWGSFTITEPGGASIALLRKDEDD